ncbi:MAG TPA: hypothetical protein VG370_18910 [Chloroflexota bacterium]|jgi:hypothetical protein|nr:hypothetical protein [Chloroflexota bacterium]
MGHGYAFPRTAFFCARCGTELRGPVSRCGCGGGAVPEGLVVLKDQPTTGRLAGLIKRVNRIFAPRVVHGR